VVRKSKRLQCRVNVTLQPLLFFYQQLKEKKLSGAIPESAYSIQSCDIHDSFMKKFLLIGIIMALLEPINLAQDKEVLPFQVPLNHFFLTIDHATFKEIQNSTFLRKEFAPSEERTTVRKDMTYTGLYFYGINTYFEFFDASQEKSRKMGDSGIAFGVEQAGASQILQSRAEGELPMQRLPVTRQLGDSQVPWFFMLRPENRGLDAGISTWTMEYDTKFLAEWHNEIADNNRGITRKEILQRYVAVLKNTPTKPFLQEVLAMTLAADKASIELLTQQGKLFGYSMHTEGNVTILQGYGFTLRLVPETAAQHGIQEITLQVNRQPDTQTEFRFGAKSILKFHGNGTATWSF